MQRNISPHYSVLPVEQEVDLEFIDSCSGQLQPVIIVSSLEPNARAASRRAVVVSTINILSRQGAFTLFSATSNARERNVQFIHAISMKPSSPVRCASSKLIKKSLHWRPSFCPCICAQCSHTQDRWRDASIPSHSSLRHVRTQAHQSTHVSGLPCLYLLTVSRVCCVVRQTARGTFRLSLCTLDRARV